MRTYTDFCLFCRVWLRILFLAVVVLGNTDLVEAQSNSSKSVKLEFYRVGERWENITGKYGSPLLNDVNSLYDETGDDLFIRCTAHHPIQWKITGLITPPEMVKYPTIKRDLDTNTFVIELIIFFLEGENVIDLASSASIACEQVANPQDGEELLVFVRGYNGPLVIPKTPVILEGDDITLIPCPTTDPISSVTQLFIEDVNNSETLVKDVNYNPIEGFRRNSNNAVSKVFSGGTYICRNGEQSVNIAVVGSPEGNQFAPVSDTVIRKFSDEFVEFHCSSESKPVKLVFTNDNSTIISFIRDEEKSKTARLSVFRDDNIISPKFSLEGKAACIAGDDKQLIKEWHWEFIDPPKLYLDNYEGEANCLSPHKTKNIVQTVRCQNGMECDFMRSCLQNETMCNFKKQKQFYATRHTRCWIKENRKGFPCTSVPFSHLNGLVKCGVFGLERQWEFFISLDYRRYSNWKDAPLRELVRIEEVTPEYSPAIQSNYFKCSAVAYLFANSLSFEIHYKNGTHSRVHGEKVTTTGPPPLLNILELNIVAVLDKRNLPEDAVKIHCIAPFWNSTETLQATMGLA